MEYVAVAFRSRTHTLEFSKLLHKFSVPNEIINTPKEAGVGCGLSVKIDTSYFSVVKRAAFSLRRTSFAGFFLVSGAGGRRTVRSI